MKRNSAGLQNFGYRKAILIIFVLSMFPLLAVEQDITGLRLSKETSLLSLIQTVKLTIDTNSIKFKDFHSRTQQFGNSDDLYHSLNICFANLGKYELFFADTKTEGTVISGIKKRLAAELVTLENKLSMVTPLNPSNKPEDMISNKKFT